MRRRLFWVGVLLSALLVAGGVVIGALGYAKTAGPDGAVRGYFDALGRSDAAAALSYGDVPAGPHTLLTATVLREQQHLAPLRHVTIGTTHRDGSKASVQVRYTLAFPGKAQPVEESVGVHRAGSDWRLDEVAISTQLQASAARQRQSIVGAGIPAGQTLVFPGALPISLDTPLLRLDPSRDSVSFDALTTTPISVEATPAARSAMVAAVAATLRRCLSGPADVTCPLPDERYVPGSIHGTITGHLDPSNVILDSVDPAGLLRFSAAVSVTGSYRRLDFHNRPVAGHGSVDLAVNALAYARAPLVITWQAS